MSQASQSQLAGQRPFQFSIRWLLAFTAVVAAIAAISVSFYRYYETGRRAMLFTQAVQAGDLKAVDQLLKADPRLAHGRVHGSANSSHTALQKALATVRTYNPKVVDRILKENPDVNERSADGQTALHIAVRLNKLAEVERLLQLGAEVNAKDDRDKTALHVAIVADSILGGRSGKLTKLLLDVEAEPNVLPAVNVQSDWKSPLQLAAEQGSAVIVEQLLASGARVNDCDMWGRTALHFAAVDKPRRHDVCKVLLDHGADLTAKDGRGLIPGDEGGSNAGIAAVIWWEHIVKLVEQKDIVTLDGLLLGAPKALSFRFVDQPGTIVHRAMAEKRLDILDILLSCPHNPIKAELELLPPLHEACSRDKPAQTAKDLLDSGIDVNIRDPFGQTALHAAAREHNHEVMRLLIAHGADVKASDYAGTTVLDASLEYYIPADGVQETLQLLRESGHPPTVLYAAAIGDIDLLKQLSNGELEALDRVYTRTGVRPLHAAMFGRQPGVVEWLLEQGVDVESTIRWSWSYPFRETPLKRALSHDLTEIAVMLIQHGADVNRKSLQGYPIHLVIQWGRDPAILEALLAHGADPMLRFEEKTAVELAKESKSKHRERYLELLDSAMKLQRVVPDSGS